WKGIAEAAAAAVLLMPPGLRRGSALERLFKLRVVLDLKGKLKGEPRVRTALDGLRVGMIGEDGMALSSR
ncbi:MAG: hypothetical protein ACOCW9_08595, partial [Thermodesulfobacteriota bacterium]